MVNFSRFSFDGIFFRSCDHLVRQVRPNYAANLKMKMWCLKSSWINRVRAGDPPRGSSYFPAPPPQDTLVPGPADPTDWLLHSGATVCCQLSLRTHRQGPPTQRLEKMLQFCTGSQRECLFLGCWLAWQPSSVKLKVVWDHSIVLTLWVDTDATKMRKARKKRKPSFRSVDESCPTLHDPMNCNTPGFHIHHQLLKHTQTHAHWVSDAI